MKILNGGGGTRRVYACTVCGERGFWDENWSYYGSIALADTCPADLPYSCSTACKEVVDQNIKSGKWVLPKLRMTPGGGVVTKGRKGY